MAPRSAEKMKANSHFPKDRRSSLDRAAILLILAAVLLSAGVPCNAYAWESAWQNTTGAEQEASVQGESDAEQTPAKENETEDPAQQDATEDALSFEQKTGIEREKQYLLEALCRLEDMGLSPVKIWSDITKDQRVTERLDSVRESVEDTVSQKVEEAGDAAADAVEEAVSKETEKIKKSLTEMIRDQITEFFSGIFGE